MNAKAKERGVRMVKAVKCNSITREKSGRFVLGHLYKLSTDFLSGVFAYATELSHVVLKTTSKLVRNLNKAFDSLWFYQATIEFI